MKAGNRFMQRGRRIIRQISLEAAKCHGTFIKILRRFDLLNVSECPPVFPLAVHVVRFSILCRNQV